MFGKSGKSTTFFEKIEDVFFWDDVRRFFLFFFLFLPRHPRKTRICPEPSLRCTPAPSTSPESCLDAWERTSTRRELPCNHPRRARQNARDAAARMLTSGDDVVASEAAAKLCPTLRNFPLLASNATPRPSRSK